MTALKEIRLWTYGEGASLRVFESEMPNTVPLLFQWRQLQSGEWARLESECAVCNAEVRDGVLVGGKVRYDTGKMNCLLLKHCLKGWNMSPLLSLDAEGVLDEESHRRALALHPRILHILVNAFGEGWRGYSEAEEGLITQQALQLFKNRKAVSNPHPHVSLYCTLATLWSKFGLNYFDYQRLPKETRDALKYISSLDNKFSGEEG